MDAPTTIVPVVRRIEASEWQAYKDIRLRALKDAPDAFGSTYEVSRTYSDEGWMTRLANASETTEFPMFATIDGKIIGLAWARIEPSESATAFLHQMWVDPTARSAGVGQRLVESGIAWASLQGVTTMALEVIIGNDTALRLYERLGFEPVGDLVRVREGSDLMEQMMVLAIG